ncbi:MAG: bifunctional 4-hydroxy-2-oxoglutarate aldolase/2-dehydro-3-deoxy-phosphogluconate aldolase [Candidatus Omnitrophica bacterium]|nr:bifunctional 4-hydroxy-2-oxoglutarate aldolase/2-dehydro-3-deoxy-phosphogluconate aldolase [Candidatus Omnitrophota bacterium]MCM8828545.1 bifunctional 4-hydroxy-2-oxoglutarate aldolase/2-dehydro-3-deoxy-phosphogluconate aldolase [Candidatus Omnitrophota bacterium]
MNSDLSILLNTGICAIIRLHARNFEIKPLIDSLIQGGIKALEISFDTPDAARLIKKIKEYAGEKILLGAGTIINSESAISAIENGAQFLISPHLDENLLRFCADKNIPCIPGVFTPTEICTAWKNGANIVKIYPASALGCKYIRAMKSGPFEKIIFMAVGGISLANAADYLAAGATILGIGGALVNDRLVNNGDWEIIEKTASHFIEIARSKKDNND